jgi:hypothetical protein
MIAMKLKRLFLFPTAAFLLLCRTTTVFARRRKDGNPQSRGIRILNRSMVRFDCYWIHPTTRVLADSQTDGDGVMPGAETSISSYIGHEFECQELPRKSTGQCVEPDDCLRTQFAVSGHEDQRK